MKTFPNKCRRAFTLVEVMVTSAIAVVVSYTGYTILHVGLLLFAKNSAINVAHQQARWALMRIENDFHSSASQVQLTAADGTLLPASSGPEAGISFQVLRGGPFLVTADAAKGTTAITANFGGRAPVVKQRLLVPLHQIEADIVSVSGSGPSYTVTLAQPLRRALKTSLPSPSGTVAANVQCFLSERVFYTVNGGELCRREATDSTATMLASGIISSAPFRLAAGSSGTFDRKMMTAVDLSTADPKTDKLGFRSSNILLNATVPVRQRIAESL